MPCLPLPITVMTASYPLGSMGDSLAVSRHAAIPHCFLVVPQALYNSCTLLKSLANRTAGATCCLPAPYQHTVCNQLPKKIENTPLQYNMCKASRLMLKVVTPGRVKKGCGDNLSLCSSAAVRSCHPRLACLSSLQSLVGSCECALHTQHRW